MSSRTYERLWQEGVSQLQSLVEADKLALVSKQMPDGQTWAQLQLGYSKAARILEKAHAGCVHPQRRSAVQIAVVAALARLLEVRRILMEIPGYETAIAAAAKEMKMSPPDWEICVPCGFREGRAEVLSEVKEIISAAGSQQQPTQSDNHPDPDGGQSPNVNDSPVQDDSLIQDGSKPPEQPGAVEPHATSAPVQPLTQEDAAVRIQAVLRGRSGRKAAHEVAQRDLAVLRVHPKVRPGARGAEDAALTDARTLTRDQLATKFDADAERVRARLQILEAPTMKHQVQQQVHKWWFETRDPVSGEHPKFLSDEDGGSKGILFPPEPDVPETPAKKAAPAKPAAKAAKGSIPIAVLKLSVEQLGKL